MFHTRNSVENRDHGGLRQTAERKRTSSLPFSRFCRAARHVSFSISSKDDDRVKYLTRSCGGGAAASTGMLKSFGYQRGLLGSWLRHDQPPQFRDIFCMNKNTHMLRHNKNKQAEQTKHISPRKKRTITWFHFGSKTGSRLRVLNPVSLFKHRPSAHTF